MARTIATIKESIRIQKNLYASLQPILFAEEGGSKVGILNNMADVIAININILEQFLDTYVAELEAIAASAVPGTSAWLQEKLFEFQYDATTPQYVQLVNLIPQYLIVDQTLRIISRASVIESGNGRLNIKVATSESPVALSGPQITALETYLDTIEPAGPQIKVTSLNADRLFVYAEIFYDGQFVASIQTDVELAINNYLASLNFDGIVFVSKLQDAIQAVNGVKDVLINQVKARKEATPYSGATVVTRYWTTVAGYIIEEDTSGHTFNDSIIYTAQQ